jgi:hypothetical protein
LAERAGPIHLVTLGGSPSSAIRNELLIYLSRSDGATYSHETRSDDLPGSAPQGSIAKIPNLPDIEC